MNSRQFETTLLALLLAGSVVFAPLALGGILSAPTPGDGGTVATLGDQETIAATLSLEPVPAATQSDTWTEPRGGAARAQLFVEIEPAHDQPHRLAVGQFAGGNWSLLQTTVAPGRSDNTSTVVRASIPGDGRYGIFGPAVTDGNESATNATALLAFTVAVAEKPGGGPTIAAPSSGGGAPVQDGGSPQTTGSPETTSPTTDNRTANRTTTENGTTVTGTTTTAEPTTQEPATTEEPTTTAEPVTTEQPTTTEESTTPEPSTTQEPTTTAEPTTEQPTTTEEPTKSAPTTTQETTTEPTTTEETTTEPTTTEETTTESSATTAAPTAEESTTTAAP
jgi:hypothetical protein